MRCLIVVLVLIVTSCGAGRATAGKLDQARKATRSKSEPEESQPSPAKKKGKLADTRRETRQPRPSASRAAPPRRRASRGHHARQASPIGWFGLSTFDCCPPPCPPPCPPAVTYVYEPAPIVVVPPPAEYVPAPATAFPTPVPSVAEAFARRFTAFPYADGSDGFVVNTALDSPIGKPWLGRIDFEAGDASDGVDRTGVGFLIEGDHGFGVDFDWHTYTERLADGGHDELHLGDVNLLYRVVETEATLVRAGVGVAWLGDAYGSEPGVNFTLRGDFAPFQPVVLSGEVDLGRLGDAEHLHLAGTAGVMLDRFEVYGGYDYRRIGDVELQGPMIGLRLWW